MIKTVTYGLDGDGVKTMSELMSFYVPALPPQPTILEDVKKVKSKVQFKHAVHAVIADGAE